MRCERIDSVLYHRVGGHVFNTKSSQVLDWFWRKFDRDVEFKKIRRNARIALDGQLVGYPIENHIYALTPETGQRIISELLARAPQGAPENFKDFLLDTFGSTLCDIYFFPYNEKIWQCPLEEIALSWLDGKLPMPDLEKIVFDNIFRKDESEMVHASFYYPVRDGSQFIIDRILDGISVKCDHPVSRIQIGKNGVVCEGEPCEAVVYTGDLRRLADILQHDDAELNLELEDLKGLQSHGTSNMLCECDSTELSWLYLPDRQLRAHRIIYTGNFAKSNNGSLTRRSCVVEFSGLLSEEEMRAELPKLPGNLRFLASNQHANSYVIHNKNSRSVIEKARQRLKRHGVFLLGRFGEWEYYNMDKAIEAAMQLATELKLTSEFDSN